jgi:maleylacetoacetate isomerase
MQEEAPALQLYGYFRSSAAYRVRIALALKGIAYEDRPVNLRLGEQQGSPYRRINPQSLVPAQAAGGRILTQSLAIIEYLEELYPEPSLLPKAPLERARVRALAMTVACDVHPVNNLRVMQYLAGRLNQNESACRRWTQHWIGLGLAAIEQELASSGWTGRFCHGDRPGLADLCLVPQLYNARRVAAPLDAYPTILRIDAACRENPAFEAARPEVQRDAPPELRTVR